jgi:hypothetical protein
MTAMMDTQPQGSSFQRGPIVAGAVLLILGVTMFLDRSGTYHLSFGNLIGPVVLITLGTSMLLERSPFVGCVRKGPLEADGVTPRRLRRRGGWTAGIWLIGVGCLMLVAQNHLFGMSYKTIWPLYIVLGGIIIVIRGLK